MAEIVPTVLCENAEDYKLTIERLSPFAKRVHIDLADGEFAPTKTVELSEMWWPQDWQVDIHAMVARPSLYVDALVQMRPSLVIFHAEVDEFAAFYPAAQSFGYSDWRRLAAANGAKYCQRCHQRS